MDKIMQGSVVGIFIIITTFLSTGVLAKNTQKVIGPIPSVFRELPADQYQKKVTESLEYLESFPESSWNQEQRLLHKPMLTGEKFDLIVAPFQTKGFPLDNIGRSLMTRYLIHALEARYKVSIANPDLMELAVSRNDRTILKNEVKDIAKKTNSKLILWGYVGHDNNGHIQVELIKEVLGAQGENTIKSTYKIQKYKFTDRNPPSEIFRDHLSGLIGKMNLSFKHVKQEVYDGKYEKEFRPIEEWLSKPVNGSIENSYRLQMLAMLASIRDNRFKEQLFERSIVTLSDVKKETKETRLLKSRAYLYLKRRPVALRYVKHANTNSLKSIRARINGNLPELRRYTKKIKRPIERIMSEIELADLTNGYNKSRGGEERNELILKHRDVAFILNRRLNDQDDWFVQSNIDLKREMDRLFTLPDYTAESVVRTGMYIFQTNSTTEQDLSVERHYRKFISKMGYKLTNEPGRISKLDHLRLYRVLGIVNVMARANKRDMQGLYKRGLRELNDIRIIYQGYPGIYYHIANLNREMMDKVRNDELDGYARKAGQNYLKVFLYGGASHKSSLAYIFYQELDQQLARGRQPVIDSTVKLKKLGTYYTSQHPIRQDWRFPMGEGERTLELLERKLLYSDTSFTAFQHLYNAYGWGSWKNTAKQKELERMLESRYLGSSARSFFLEQLYSSKNNVKKLNEISRKEVSQKGQQWEAYVRLAVSQIVDGNYDKAFKILTNYPLFKMKDTGRGVELSNLAYEAGSIFFWRGDQDKTKKLYLLSASYNAGSDAEMSARERLAILDGEYSKALRITNQRVRRYQTDYANRDLLAWLHAFGYSDQARVLFDSMLPSQRSTQIWTGALIGQRINNTDKEEMLRWVNERMQMKRDHESRKISSKYVFMALALDRPVDPDLVGIIEKMGEFIVNGKQGETKVKDRRFIRFVTAYNIVKTIVENRYIFDIEKIHTLFKNIHRGTVPVHILGPDYELPYLTWIALQTGEKGYIQNIITTFSENSSKGTNDHKWSSPLFYRDLSFSIIEASKKNHKKAMQYLRSAFNRRPHVGEKPIYTWYQMTEIAEWLYLEHGFEGYRNLVIEWSKMHQVIRPMYAWAYAFEAKYTKDAVRRKRALAFTLYLDKKSSRIRHFSQKEKEEAKKYFETINPFDIHKQQVNKKAA